MSCYHIINHNIIYIVDVKRQNRLKVGTDKPKLKVKMHSVSDDDVRKKFNSLIIKIALFLVLNLVSLTLNFDLAHGLEISGHGPLSFHLGR